MVVAAPRPGAGMGGWLPGSGGCGGLLAVLEVVHAADYRGHQYEGKNSQNAKEGPGCL